MNRKENRPSKISYEKHLNGLGVPEELKKSNGGHVPDYVKYGTWLRVNFNEQFESDYTAWREKIQAGKS